MSFCLATAATSKKISKHKGGLEQIISDPKTKSQIQSIL